LCSQAAGRPLEIGESSDGAGSRDGSSDILLSYHQHDFSLGAHYNAVAKK
jgi:hypothetical protein